MKRSLSLSRGPNQNRPLTEDSLIRVVGGNLAWNGEFIHGAPWSVGDRTPPPPPTTP